MHFAPMVQNIGAFTFYFCNFNLEFRCFFLQLLRYSRHPYKGENTVNQAKARRDTDLPLILHSDRGSQYVSKAYREVTEKFQLSYSHKGYPYDNACIKSFHSLIKREWLNRFRIENRAHAYRLVFEYIEAFYNTVRIHSHCGYMSPDQFEKLKANVA